MHKLLFILFLLGSPCIKAQDEAGMPDQRRKATKPEVNILAHLTDSVLRELKGLYRSEIKEEQQHKYQPERIALVRSYLLLFEHIENSVEVIAYTKADITRIFGKPDSAIKKAQEEEWLYGNLEKKYIRISNLRYRFYYRNKILYAVKRD